MHLQWMNHNLIDLTNYALKAEIPLTGYATTAYVDSRHQTHLNGNILSITNGNNVDLLVYPWRRWGGGGATPLGQLTDVSPILQQQDMF